LPSLPVNPVSDREEDARPAAATASPIRWMPNPPPARCNPAGPAAPAKSRDAQVEMIRVLRVAGTAR
jgi:hypothetical protein